MDGRLDETRVIRAPRGTQRSARSWLTGSFSAAKAFALSRSMCCSSLSTNAIGFSSPDLGSTRVSPERQF